MKNGVVLILFTALIFTVNPASVIYPQQNDDPAAVTFKKAQKYFFQRKFEMAELLLQESLKKNPENYLAYSYLGDIFLNKKRYDGAIQLYKKAMDLKPGNAENYFRLGQIYYYKKMGNPSVENYRKSLELDESMKFSYYQMGLSYLMLLRDKDNTIKNWEIYLVKAPEDPQYEKIRRVVELLKDPNFIIPPEGSEISIEEALHLGGSVLKNTERDATRQKADHEKRKTKNSIEEIYRDDDL